MVLAAKYTNKILSANVRYVGIPVLKMITCLSTFRSLEPFAVRRKCANCGHWFFDESTLMTSSICGSKIK
jgi:hypothetical protein